MAMLTAIALLLALIADLTLLPALLIALDKDAEKPEADATSTPSAAVTS